MRAAASPENRRATLAALLGMPLEGGGIVLSGADGTAPAGEPLDVLLTSAGGTDIPAYLLRPDPSAATGAAVVLVAGHGRGIDDLVRTDPADEYHDALAHKLARAGLTVPGLISSVFSWRPQPR